MTSEWDTDIAEQLIVGNFPNGGFIDIGADVSPEIVAFYLTKYGGSVTKAWIKFQQSPAFYSYIVAFQTAPGGTDAALAYGHVHNLVVFEERVSFIVPVAVPPLPQVQVHNGLKTQMYETWGDKNAGAADPLTQLYFQNAQLFWQSTANGRTAGTDFFFDGVSLSRGTQDGVRGTSTTGIVVPVAGTETDLPFLALNPTTYASRVYKGFARLLATQSVATDVFQINWRRDTALTGTLLGLSRFSLGSTSAAMDAIGHLLYDAAIDESLLVFVSVVRQSGTGTLTVAPRITGGNGRLSSWSEFPEVGAGGTWRTV